MPVALITGANRGIGLGVGQHYLAKGWRVCGARREPDAATNLHEEGGRHPGQLTILPMDVTSDASIATARARVGEQAMRLDLLINNAGVFEGADALAGVTTDALRRSFDANAIAPVIIAKAFADLLAGGGKLVHITMPTQPVATLTRRTNHPYVASRYALNALTKMIALELAERGVIAVALYPGYLRTDMNAHASAAKPVAEGVPLAAAVIDGLTAADNGQCFLPDGRRQDW